eukprot:CAMPEP_0202705942 /NCGR_PEP_ID=MMETSP1385-20130828/18443_1 /ASSEMBLY_ACC=CAM_ASM_000861 /TAXON_ID=933848 /ORGANISM="Elphidium margaritaceum" /LENGTH=311 /DNA_ID=CAMNT_0049364305 /DNA_START=153 /DNA_END=1088 /DNA_ORIENTATION=+
MPNPSTEHHCSMQLQQPPSSSAPTSGKSTRDSHRPNIIRIISVKNTKLSSPSRSMSNSPCSPLSASRQHTYLQVDKHAAAAAVGTSYPRSNYLVPSPSTSPHHAAVAVYVPLNGNNLELPQTYSPRPPHSFSSIHLLATTPHKLSISRSEWSSMSNPYSSCTMVKEVAPEPDHDHDEQDICCELSAEVVDECVLMHMHDKQESQSESNWMMYTHIQMNKNVKTRTDMEHMEHMELPNSNGNVNLSVAVTSPSPSPSPSAMLATCSVQLFATHGDARGNNFSRAVSIATHGQSPYIAQSLTPSAQFGGDDDE